MQEPAMKAKTLRAVFLLVPLLLAPRLLCGQAQVGEVSFENSGSAAAQKDFLHGLAQLHNFEYDFAAADFQNAQKTDPDFVMAYWGEAMTHNHPIWMEQDADAARAALKKLGPTSEARAAKAMTPREKAYLHAVEILYGDGEKFDRDFKYAEAMRSVHEAYPNDIEATCFYALSLLGTAHNGRDIPTYMRAAGLLEDIFYAHPHHPGAAHYLIHSFDDPIHAPLGLPAARAYSRIAPDAGHAQHMTSHIFLALGMWDDVVTANENAMAVVNRQRKAIGKPEGYCGHYNEWLQYAYLQQGRFAKAKKLTQSCRDQSANVPASAHSHGLAPSFLAMQAQYLMDTKDWSGDVASWTAPGELIVFSQFDSAYNTAYAAAQRGDLTKADSELLKLQTLAPRVGAEYDSIGIAKDDPVRGSPQIEADQIRALILAAGNKLDAAIELARSAAKREEALPFAFGPPSIPKPSHELLGELLLKNKDLREAREAFTTSLSRTPRRTQSLLGLLQTQLALGEKDEAAKTEAALREIRKVADSVNDASQNSR
jgi:tetratricopeptide (TPR) repeat protein